MKTILRIGLPLLLTVIVVGNSAQLIMYLVALYTSFSHDISLSNIVTPARPLWAIHAVGLSALIDLFFVVFIVKQKKWAVFGLGASMGFGLVIHFLVEGELHLPTIVVLVFLYLLLHPQWHALFNRGR